jgi:hypothetical protein
MVPPVLLTRPFVKPVVCSYVNKGALVNIVSLQLGHDVTGQGFCAAMVAKQIHRLPPFVLY